jgi:DNA/RNA endonuclease G (NUC1)
MSKFQKLALAVIVLVSVTKSASCQNVDTVIVTPIYESYFSYETHTPLFVVYNLYKGGGDCSRQGMIFHNGGVATWTYEKGYDIGHMANAEDFAGDCNKEAMTFYFYNALPQTPKLNRGIWKHFETEIRKLSQTDSLQIICGGFQFHGDIPDFCYKIVRDLKTDITTCYLFPNDNSDTFTEIPLNVLLSKIPYKLFK